MSAPNCSFNGNTDFYGFGIRLGLYFQFVATLLVTLFAPEEEPFYRAVNNLLQTALLAGLFAATKSTNPPLYTIEPPLIIFLFFGSLSSLTGDGFNPLGTLSGLYRLLLYTGIAGYSVWFWFDGVENTALRPPQGCPETVFFGNVSPFGPFRTFNKVFSIIGLVICGVLLIWSIKRLFTGTRASALHAHRVLEERRTDLLLLISSVTIIIISIAGAEWIVRANHMVIASVPGNPGIYDINAVGQIVPLLVGGLGMIETLKDVILGVADRSGPRVWYIGNFKLEDIVAGLKKGRIPEKANSSTPPVDPTELHKIDNKTPAPSVTASAAGQDPDDVTKTPIARKNSTD